MSISRSRFCLAVIVLVLLSGTFLPAAESFSATLVGKLKVGKAPHFADLSVNGRFLYVTAFASNEVAIIDVNTSVPPEVFTPATNPLALRYLLQETRSSSPTETMDWSKLSMRSRIR